MHRRVGRFSSVVKNCELPDHMYIYIYRYIYISEELVQVHMTYHLLNVSLGEDVVANVESYTMDGQG